MRGWPSPLSFPAPASNHSGHVRVYLDPGHGGSDTGAVGNGLREKDVTLDLALRLNYINNPSDAALLRRNDFRHAIATGPPASIKEKMA